MPPTSKTTFINECRSFISGQYTEKRDAPKRILRPPNAFMLYRSDFLKRRAIPPEVEKRQQNLSRIAGQCWNMLPETERAIWYSKAAVIRAEHRARYPSHKTGPFHKDTDKISTKDKRRGSATNSARSSGQSRTRRTQSPYCENMFAALHDSKFSSPASQASLLSPTPASMSPLSTTASLSPLLLPQLLPLFIPYTHPSWQDSPPATSGSSTVWKHKFGCPLDASGSEIPQRGPPQIIRDLETTPVEIGSSKAPIPALQQFEDGFATCVPHLGPKQPLELRSDPVAQVALTLPVSNIFSPERAHLAACPPLANDFGVTDDFAHFDQSLDSLYPWYSDESNTSK